MFIIHGVGGDNLSASAEIFNNLANYLQQHSEIWCATFGDVVRYIQERKAIGIGAPESNDRRVQFKLRWTLDANL